MCLLDRVERWNNDSLVATTRTHRRSDHPLRRDGRLHAIHGLEYAAQAMAVHGGLRGLERGQMLSGGLLAAARDLRLLAGRLDTLPGVIEVRIVEEYEQGGSMIYRFRLDAPAGPIIEGTAVVIGREPIAPAE